MKVNVYVDGFNLYYGAVKGTPYRWLDLSKLCRLMLPKDEINQIRYFTALIRSRPDDPDKPQRQQAYLRALQTISNLAVHKGMFLSRPARMALVAPQPNGPKTVEVWDTKEKGSDVNLASWMIFDGVDRDYDVAVIISNDSDLMLPIKMIRERLGLGVGVLNPHPSITSYALLGAASFYKPIRQGVLRKSLFPDTMEDTQGVFHKPTGW